MVKDIITIAFNSLEVEKTIDNNNNNILFSMNTPPIIIRNKGILKVSNFCHIGTSTGHTENMYLFKIKGVIADTSRFITGSGGGFPLILTTTFNNNRSLYDENVITLTKQTINAIDIIVDTYSSSATINDNLYIINAGSGYLIGQRLKLTIVSTDYDIEVKDINLNGGIKNISFITTAPTTVFTSVPITTLTTFINGSGAVLFVNVVSGVITSVIVTTAGKGYKIGQTVLFSGAGSGAVASITAIGSLGEITAVTVTNGGTGYTTPTTSINSTTQTQTAIFGVSFGKILYNSIPSTLNFSITFIIEQDVNE